VLDTVRLVVRRTRLTDPSQ
jgi:hypothetical protein